MNDVMDIIDKLGRLVRDPSVQVDTTGFIFALTVSAVVGSIVSGLYQMFYENRATGSQIHRCFLLMSPAITAIFIAIQFSLPLSLGLLGALSIVRFRTPIKEPEEVGFLMLLIASAVVCATFQFLLLVVLLVLAVIVLALQRLSPHLLRSKRKDGVLLITLASGITNEAKDEILKLLGTRLSNGRIEGISQCENLTTIHYSFTRMNLDSLRDFQANLNEVAPIKKLNIFFNGQGVLL
ncbi:MAG: DUF4956 domain-containing protein [Planctomycetes bacterium]|nr:DUF4956 domain-containing protein [Planctomycetota bacterium]